MRHQHLGLLLLLCAFACTQNSKQPEGGQAERGSANTGLTFAFSQYLATLSSAKDKDWCHIALPEAAVISADPANFNRRLFTLSDGPHRVIVDFGNIVASFVLLRSGNKVEIFTSDNYPECLSNRANFTIGQDGNTFQYDNHKHIQFEMQLMPQPNGTQIALEMAPGAGYGIIVRR